MIVSHTRTSAWKIRLFPEPVGNTANKYLPKHKLPNRFLLFFPQTVKIRKWRELTKHHWERTRGLQRQPWLIASFHHYFDWRVWIKMTMSRHLETPFVHERVCKTDPPLAGRRSLHPHPLGPSPPLPLPLPQLCRPVNHSSLHFLDSHRQVLWINQTSCGQSYEWLYDYCLSNWWVWRLQRINFAAEWSSQVIHSRAGIWLFIFSCTAVAHIVVVVVVDDDDVDVVMIMMMMMMMMMMLMLILLHVSLLLLLVVTGYVVVLAYYSDTLYE